MARHMRQVFKFENFKNQVGLDFKFFSGQVGLWLILDSCLDELPVMSGYGYEIHSQNPGPVFFAGFNEWLKEPIKFTKKLKL